MKRIGKHNTTKLLLAALIWLIFVGNGFSQSVKISIDGQDPENPNEYCQHSDPIILSALTQDIKLKDISQYSWLISVSGKDGPFNDTIIVTDGPTLEPGTDEPGSKWYTVEVIYEDSPPPDTVRSNDTVEIKINALPTSNIRSDKSICKGNNAEITIDFEGTGPWNFQINEVERSSSESSYDSLVSPGTTTTYTVTRLEDANGCLAADSLMKGEAVITVLDLPTFSISAEDRICAGNTDSIVINLTGESPWKLQYAPEQGQGIDLLITADTTLVVGPDKNTTYDFTLLEDGNGCSPSEPGKNKSLTIEVQEPPSAGTGAAVEICAGDTIIVLNDDTVYITEGEMAKNLFSFLEGIPDTGGDWDPPTINLNLAKIYTYIVEAKDPCTEDASAQIKIIEQPKKDALSIIGKPYDDPVLLIYPENELEYRWYKEGEKEVLDTSQYYLFNSPGNYYVKVNTPGSYCSTESEKFIVYPGNDTTVAKSLDTGFDFFPNPAGDHITIILNDRPVSDAGHLTLKIVSIEGSCVFEKNISNVMEGIDVQRLLPGIYTIFIVSDEKITGTQKLILAR